MKGTRSGSRDLRATSLGPVVRRRGAVDVPTNQVVMKSM
jgi:hypothetical protein